jgi:nucleoside-diphosphate-sugar epimerase
MDVFLTGGSGYLGGVIIEHLRAAGHQVSALARSDSAAARVTGKGAQAVPGDLLNVDALRASSERADAVVHAAIDYADPAMGDIESTALAAMLAGAKGKPFVYTSTGLVYATRTDRTALITEEDPVDETTAAQPHKILGERAVLAADGTVLRAPLVHGRGGSGLLQGLLSIGRTQKIVPFIGDGRQVWSAVHVDDLADLFVLAIEKPEPGIFNAASGDTFEIGQLAAAVAELTGAAAVPVTPEGAMAPLAVLARTGGLDGSKAREAFGWTPERPGLLDDVRGEAYAG